jgi:hypothetical protein
VDIYSLGIPNIRTTKVGSRRDGVEIVEAAVRLEAWDGYLVKRWENGRAIADGTIVLTLRAPASRLPKIGTRRSAHITGCWKSKWDIRDRILKYFLANFDTLKEEYHLDPDDDPDVPRITGSNREDFDLRPFIGPPSVSIREDEKDDIA